MGLGHLGGGVVEATLRGVQTSGAGAVEQPHLTIEEHFSYFLMCVHLRTSWRSWETIEKVVIA